MYIIQSDMSLPFIYFSTFPLLGENNDFLWLMIKYLDYYKQLFTSKDKTVLLKVPWLAMVNYVCNRL